MHWPEKLFLAYTIITIVLVAIGLYDMSVELVKVTTVPKYNLFLAISSLYALFFVVLGSVKIIFAFMQKTFQIDLLRRCELNRFVGFFLISLCGIIPRLLAYFANVRNISFDYFLVTTSLLFANILYFLFVFGTHKYCTHDRSLSKRIFNWNISIQLIVLFASLFLATVFSKDPETVIICLYQIGFFGLCLAGIQELFEIHYGGLKLKQNDSNGEELQSVKVGVSKKGPEFYRTNNEEESQGYVKLVRQPLKLECKICMLEYSDPSRIPRILKECGHTVCEKCVDELLKKAHNGNHIFCPLCQAVTVVHGPASTLPKNYETMAMMAI